MPELNEVFYEKKSIEEGVKKQNKLRFEKNNDYFYYGPGIVISNKPYSFKEGNVPVMYSAGGMVPSLPFYQKDRIVKQNFQHYIIEKTGGIVHSDKTSLSIKPSITYGNCILENPMENGSSSRRVFPALDYIKILLSHGSINFIQAEYNYNGNPGYAAFAEIVAQYAKGGANIICNEKGTINLENESALTEKETFLFDKFIYDPSCLVKSLDDAIDIVNHNNGKTLSNLILKANENHNEYLKSIENYNQSKKVFIGGSIKDEWAKEAGEFCKSNAIPYFFARDLVNPEENPIEYLKQMNNGCNIILTYQHSRINQKNNRLLPYAESGFAVINKKRNIHLSEQIQVIEQVLEEYPEIANGRSITHVHIDENLSNKNARRKAKEIFDTMRLSGPDFLEHAPFTLSYPVREFGWAMSDLKKLNEVLK